MKISKQDSTFPFFLEKLHRIINKQFKKSINKYDRTSIPRRIEDR